MKVLWVLCLLSVFFASPSVLTRKQLAEYPELSIRYKWLDRKLYAIVVEEAVRQKEDYKLILAIIDAESGGKRKARSKVGARGLMQIMKCNYKGDQNDLFNKRINVRTGIRTYKMWQRVAQGNLILALNYYQRGYIPGANVKYLAKISHNYWSSL